MKMPLLSLALLLLPAAALPGQGLPAAGFGIEVRVKLPGQTFLSGFDLLSGGDLVWLAGSTLYRRGSAGTGKIFTISGTVYGSFVENTVQGVYFAESSRGGLYRYDPAAARTVYLAKVDNAFDLAESPGGSLYLSRGYLVAPNQYRTRISRLHPTKGTLTDVADLSGPSGPLAFDGAGNLYYTVMPQTCPAPPGSIFIVRWSAKQLAQAGPQAQLAVAGGMVAWSGLDGAYDLVLDRWGRACVSDPISGGIRRYRPGSSVPEQLVTVNPLTGTGHTVLRLVTSPAPATLDPWQPTKGAALLAAASDYTLFSQVEELAPRRPALAMKPWPDVPAGPVDLTLRDAPPAVPGIVLLSPAVIPGETPLLPGSLAPLYLGVLPHYTAQVIPLRTTNGGRWNLSLPYHGGGPLRLYAQAYFAAPLPCSSNPWAFRLL